MVLCPKCNTENKETSIYCKKCGIKIEEELQIQALRNRVIEKISIAEKMRQAVLQGVERYESKITELQNSLRDQENQELQLLENLKNEPLAKLEKEKEDFQQEQQMQEANILQFLQEIERLEAEAIQIDQEIQNANRSLAGRVEGRDKKKEK